MRFQKLSILAAALAAFVFFATPLMAADRMEAPGEKKPPMTSPGYISLLYYRMTGQLPDFERWAESSDDYIQASEFDKMMVRDEKANELKKIFSLLTVTEPVVMEKTVKLSQYSRTNEGFFIEGLKPDMFFSFSFMDKSYAVIPIGIMDKQWIKVRDPEKAAAIANAVDMRDGAVNMVLHVVPQTADKTAPMSLDGRDHWLIAAEIKDLALYQVGTGKLLWQNMEGPVDAQTHQELMGLFSK